MKENAIRKINKIGKIGGIITIIAKVLITICLVGCIIGGIVFAVMPRDFINVRLNGNAIVDLDWSNIGYISDKIKFAGHTLYEKSKYKELDGSISLNGVEYKIDDVNKTQHHMTINTTAKEYQFNIHSMVWVMLMVIVNLAMTMITLIFIGALCKAVKNCSSPFETDIIKKMQNLAISLIPWVILSNISEMIAKGIVTGRCDLALTFNLKIVFIILLIFALVYIFKYGAVLQQESDETL